MENQESVQELPQLVRLRLRQFQAQTFRPVIFQKRADDLFSARRQFCLAPVWFKTQLAKQFQLKRKNNLRRGFFAAETAEKSAQQSKNGGQGSVRLRRLRDEICRVSRLLQFQNVLADRA